jgi:hypothetical protein
MSGPAVDALAFQRADAASSRPGLAALLRACRTAHHDRGVAAVVSSRRELGRLSRQVRSW